MRSNNLSYLFLALILLAAAGCGSDKKTSAPSLTTLSVTPTNPSIMAGTSQHYVATGIYSDGSTQNLTASATWSSSTTTVAAVSNSAGQNGLVSALAAGTTTIKAASGSISGSTTLTVTAAPASTTNNNVMTVTVNGSLCSNSYSNKPCVSVTVCTPGTTSCQTVNDILLDTGSYGLRIFKQALSVSLTQLSTSSGSLAECVRFADGSADWGPIKEAGVILGSEPSVQVPIQVIDSTFGTVPSGCGTPDTSPSTAGFNGILGVGLFAEDCGSVCASYSVGLYYACNGTSCSSTAVPLTSQVLNPVVALPYDNNGVMLSLPSVASGGTTSVTGALYLGIGTQANNTPAFGVKAYSANGYGEFSTALTSTISLSSFIDSGSNGLFFDASQLGTVTECTGLYASWFCPSSTMSLSATNRSSDGMTSGTVSFEIGNAVTLFNSSNNVFAELGGSFPGYFDWGLPFHLGKQVYTGIENKSSSLGTGPYWAY
jgi:hypothetical protein